MMLGVLMPAQAEPSFAEWREAAVNRNAEISDFESYLARANVAGVLPTEQLLRNATSWQSCGLTYPYSMPPKPLWGNIMRTLEFLRDELEPQIGPVHVESGYREPALNRCSHGAPKSAHALYYALDFVPDRTMTRSDLIAKVCRLHARRGAPYRVGLGFYDGVRFHIDTKAYRRWGSDNHGGTSPCAKVRG